MNRYDYLLYLGGGQRIIFFFLSCILKMNQLLNVVMFWLIQVGNESSSQTLSYIQIKYRPSINYCDRRSNTAISFSYLFLRDWLKMNLEDALTLMNFYRNANVGNLLFNTIVCVEQAITIFLIVFAKCFYARIIIT